MTNVELVKKHGIQYLTLKAQADVQKALASLTLLLDCPVGIGDHSTGDYTKNLDEALDQLVDAEDRLSTLLNHFPDYMVMVKT